MAHLHRDDLAANNVAQLDLNVFSREYRALTDAFPSVFRVHSQHGDVATTKHLLMHVQLTYDGADTLLLHHGL